MKKINTCNLQVFSKYNQNKIICNIEKMRKKGLQKLESNEIIAKFDKKLAQTIEEEMYKKTCELCGINRMSNFMEPIYWDKIINIEYDIANFSDGDESRIILIMQEDRTLTNPDYWEKKAKKIEMTIVNNNTLITTKAYQCKACNVPNTCVFFVLQTRSIDEPDTITIRCTNCGKTWRKN